MTFFTNTPAPSVDSWRPPSVSPAKNSLIFHAKFRTPQNQQQLKRMFNMGSMPSSPTSATATLEVLRQPDLQDNSSTAPVARENPLRLLGELSGAVHKLQHERDTCREQLKIAIEERNEAVEEARKLRVENERLQDTLLQFQRAIDLTLAAPGASIEGGDEEEEGEIFE